MEIKGIHLDTDSYYWLPTDPPFTQKRDPAARIALIERDVSDAPNWVLSGSLCSWGDPLLHRFTLGVFLYLDPAIRLARLVQRERHRFGKRVLSGGDMRTQHLEFMEWARSYDHAKAPVRSLDLHTKWMRRLSCPLLRLDSNRPLDELRDEVMGYAHKATRCE